MKRVSISVGALMAAMMLSPAAAQDVAAQGLKKLSIVVFGSPSLGAFLPLGPESHRGLLVQGLA